MNTKLVVFGFCTVAGIVLAGSNVSVSDGNASSASVWGKPLSATDQLRVRSHTVVLDKDLSASEIWINYGGDSSVIVDQNYTLSAKKAIEIGRKGGTQGKLIQSAGRVTAAALYVGGTVPASDDDKKSSDRKAGKYDLSGGELSVSGPLSVSIHGSELNISGGKITAAKVTVDAALSVSGNSASISFGSLNATADTGSEIKLVFGADGMSPINVSGAADLSYTALTIDGSAYTGSATTFTLLTAGTLKNIASGFNVIGFSKYTLDQNTSTGVVKLNLIR
jgi:hypothetical protein